MVDTSGKPNLHFRARPFVVEAWKVGGPDDSQPDWLKKAEEAGEVYILKDQYIQIRTFEGIMRANVGDWIVRNEHGHLHPCKADIFAATYEPA